MKIIGDQNNKKRKHLPNLCLFLGLFLCALYYHVVWTAPDAHEVTAPDVHESTALDVHEMIAPDFDQDTAPDFSEDMALGSHKKTAPDFHRETVFNHHGGYFAIPHPKQVFANYCPSSSFSRRHQIDFNLTTDHWQEWRLLESADIASYMNLRGVISIQNGNLNQTSDIEIVAIVSSTQEADLDNVVFRASDDGLEVDYNFDKSMSDLCTEVGMVVYLRPKIDASLFEVRTNILGIVFFQLVELRVLELFIHSVYGRIWLDGYWPSFWDHLMAHQISVSSKYGNISGEIHPTEYLNVHSEHGDVSLALEPSDIRYMSASPRISLSTTGGSILIEAVLYKEWRQIDYKYEISLSTVSGDIVSYLPHNLFSNYTTVSGDISCSFKRWGGHERGNTDPHISSELHTHTESGTVRVAFGNVLELIHGGSRDSERIHQGQDRTPEQRDRILGENSYGAGMLMLKYGYDWWGLLDEVTTSKDLTFTQAWTQEKGGRGEGYIVANRSKTEGSEIKVDAPRLEIKIDSEGDCSTC